MAIPVGWLATFSGTQGSPLRSVEARLYSSAGMPVRTQLENAVQDKNLLHLRFDPSGGWVIICAGGTVFYSQAAGGPAFSEAATTAIADMPPDEYILNDIFFTPTGDFIVKFYLPAGGRHYVWSNNFPQEILSLITSNDDPNVGPGTELLGLVFPPPTVPAPTQTSLGSLIWTSCIMIFANNNVLPFNAPPPDIMAQIKTIQDRNLLVTGAVYTSSNGWLVTAGNNLFSSPTFDPWLLSQLTQATAWFAAEKLNLTLSDVVVEVPIRNITFQILTIQAKQIRSGWSSPQDTVSAEIAISVNGNPPVTATVGYGNTVENGMVLGLGSPAPQPPGGLMPLGPNYLVPPLYAVSVGPVPISGPLDSVALSYIVINQANTKGPLSFVSVMSDLASLAINGVEAAVTAGAGAIGVPAIGSITTAIINKLNTGGFATGGCDGLLAMDTFSMPGATLAALNYGSDNGYYLQQQLEYNNIIFPDSLLTGKLYDSSGNPTCNAPDYLVTSTILEQDSECVVTYGPPSAAGATVVLYPTDAFPAGQTINGADSTPRPLSSCIYNGAMYLFWTAHDASGDIWFTSSSDGRHWPNGQIATFGPQDPRPIGNTQLAPASCVYDNELGTMMYVFWIAGDGSDTICYSITRDGARTFWSQGPVNPSITSRNPPAACVFKNQLFLFWTANDNSWNVFVSSYAGAIDEGGAPTGPNAASPPWPTATALIGFRSFNSPAAVIFQNQMFLFWANSDQLPGGAGTFPANAILFSSTEDGQNFSPPNPINGVDTTPDGLAACVIENQLFLFWKANDGEDRIYYASSWDGKTWGQGRTINTTDSSPGELSACVFNNRVSLFWRADDSSDRIFTSISRPPVCMSTTKIEFIPTPFPKSQSAA